MSFEASSSDNCGKNGSSQTKEAPEEDGVPLPQRLSVIWRAGGGKVKEERRTDVGIQAEDAFFQRSTCGESKHGEELDERTHGIERWQSEAEERRKLEARERWELERRGEAGWSHRELEVQGRILREAGRILNMHADILQNSQGRERAQAVPIKLHVKQEDAKVEVKQEAMEVMVEEVVRAEKVQEDEFLFEADQLLKDSAWDQLLELYLPERTQQVTGGATESLCCHKASTCNDNTKERNHPWPPKGCSRQDQSGDGVIFV